jgi:hypothetical protein
MSFMRLPFRQQPLQNQTGAPTHFETSNSGESANPGSHFGGTHSAEASAPKKGLTSIYLFPSLIQDVNSFDNDSIISTSGSIFVASNQALLIF